MLDLSPDKLFMLGLVALVVLGPNRLPQVARSLGHLVGQMRSFTSSMQGELHDALQEPHEAFGAALAEITELNPAAMRRSVRRAVTDTLLAPGPAGPQPTGTTSGPAPEASAAPAGPGAAEPSPASDAAGRPGPRPLHPQAPGSQTPAARPPGVAGRPFRTPEDPSFN